LLQKAVAVIALMDMTRKLEILKIGQFQCSDSNNKQMVFGH
jgi:hypothetical protein